MRSVAVALLSSLLLSPISVLAHYPEGEHAQHPQHVNEPSYEVDHKKQEKSYAEHSVAKISDHSTKKVVQITVDIEVKEDELDDICQKKEESCLEAFDCDESKRLCRKKSKCRDQKKICLSDYKCQRSSKKCRLESTKRYGFRCGRKFFNQAKVLAAAKAACPKISKNAQKSTFPAPHTAFEFSANGPYVEWPISRTGKIWNKKSRSKHRIVMTMDCKVVGAVTRKKHAGYSKCRFERH